MRIILPVLSILAAGGGVGSRWPPEFYELEEPGPGDIHPYLVPVLDVLPAVFHSVMNSFIYHLTKVVTTVLYQAGSLLGTQ